MSTIDVRELIYDCTLRFTGVTEYGLALESLLARKVSPPAEGVRVDIAFEGTSSGPKLKGTVHGVDYLSMRADGRFQLHIHATITTEDGQNISLHADGVASLREGSAVSDLRENVTLFSSSPRYTWVNFLQVWGIGTVDLNDRVIHVKGYAA